MNTHVCLSCMPSVTSMPGPLSFMITIQCAPSSSKRASTVAEAPTRSLKDQILTARLVPDGSGINQSESGALDSLRCSIRSIPKIGWSTPALYAKSCCQGFRCFRNLPIPGSLRVPSFRPRQLSGGTAWRERFRGVWGTCRMLPKMWRALRHKFPASRSWDGGTYPIHPIPRASPLGGAWC